jgi:hypothetical protein
VARVVASTPDVAVTADQIALLAIELIKVLDLAQSAYLLHLLHKDDINTWILVKDKILAVSTGSRIFSTVIDVLAASSKDALDESAYLIPGVLTVRQRTLVP